MYDVTHDLNIWITAVTLERSSSLLCTYIALYLIQTKNPKDIYCILLAQ